MLFYFFKMFIIVRQDVNGHIRLICMNVTCYSINT